MLYFKVQCLGRIWVCFKNPSAKAWMFILSFYYTCYSVTVPRTIGGGQKLTLYLYINIEVFLGYGKTLSRTVTLKHCNATEKNRKNWWFIRRPQWKCFTFALSIRTMELERRATKICFQAWQNFLPAQSVKRKSRIETKWVNQRFSINIKNFLQLHVFFD